MKKIAVCMSGKNGWRMFQYVYRNRNEIPIELICVTGEEPFAGWARARGWFYDIPVISVENKKDKRLHEELKKRQIDLMFLLWWPYILKKETIDLVKEGVINTHPSLLPYNRGKHPYYWSIVEDTPAGATLHYITPGIDEGGILVQQGIPKDITMTGGELWQKSADLTCELFAEHYEELANGEIKPRSQILSLGTSHLGKDLEVHSKIDLERHYRADDLLNIIRGRTFDNDNPGAFFERDGKKYSVKIKIEEVKND